MIRKSRKGQLLVELILAIGISAIILPALLTGLYASRQSRPQQQQRVQAVALMQQVVTAVENIKNSNWSLFAVDGTYHAAISNNKWIFVTNAQTVNGFTQQVIVSDIYRSTTGAIVTSGGTLDPSTKQVTITISWSQPTYSSLTTTLYLSRTTDLTYTQTTVSDFSAGILTGTAVTNISGGEVELGAGNANWCRPQNYVINQVSLPKLSNALYGVPGDAYLGSGDGASGSAMFINVGITTPAPPASPSASVAGTFNGGYVTNAIYSDGTYVYLATTNPTSQVIILDTSHTPYTQVGTITIPGGNPANGVAAAGNVLYVTSSNMLYSFDITNKTGSHTVILGSQQMYAGFWQTNPTARQVTIANNKAYVGTGNTFLGLQVFSIGNGGQAFSFVGASNLTYNQQSQGLTVNSSGTRAYVAFNNGTGWANGGFFIIDVGSSPPWWWPFYSTVGQYSASPTNPTGMTVVPGNNRAIIVGTGGTQQYQVVDISNEANPTLCGYLNIPSGVYGVSSVLDQYNNAYSYIITGETGSQFKIIQGGNGGNFSSSGTFESSTFNPGYSAAFNRFQATIAQPSQTSIQMQVAVANAINGSCSNAAFTYVGPNGNTTAYFTPNGTSISGQIPFGNYNPNYQNPAQCFRYKVWFTTTDMSQTPVLYDMTVNYSP
ncbi:MAG TPA: hypothetical protein VNW29_05595 [Candidatus Sulfotelmatobacter sp.]|jgi:hypothetical protein|nr:hypothetical protein [Candidatus Sulfotelmatobacter sp.]